MILNVIAFFIESLFIFQQHEQINFDICILLTSSVAGVSSLFFYCYFGRLATEIFGNMADCLFDSNWQCLPLKIQRRHLIIMIQNAQRPLHYHGVGIVVLNLNTFGKVIKSVYSCYMVFKTMTV